MTAAPRVGNSPTACAAKIPGEAAMAINATSVREGESVSEINITPLIDVMLVLLIMLIVTLPPQRHAVMHDTPVPCKGCPDPESPDPISIEVDFNGALSWNGSPIAVA